MAAIQTQLPPKLCSVTRAGQNGLVAEGAAKAQSFDAEEALEEDRDLLSSQDTQDVFPSGDPTEDRVSEYKNETLGAEPNPSALAIARVKDWVAEGSNLVSIVGNLISFVVKVLPSSSEAVKQKADRVGELATKQFFMVNGGINTVDKFKDKNVLSCVGYFLDFMFGLLLPQNKIYLSKGYTVFATQFANIVNLMNKKPGEDNCKFESIADYGEKFKEGCLKVAKNLKKPIANFFKNESGVAGAIGGALSFIGPTLWLLTGNEKFAAAIRNTGGGLLDIEQTMPYHYNAGRTWYPISGLLYIAGTVFDTLAKYSPKYENILRPLCFLTDGMGRDALRRSEVNKEMSYDESHGRYFGDVFTNFFRSRAERNKPEIVEDTSLQFDAQESLAREVESSQSAEILHMPQPKAERQAA